MKSARRYVPTNCGPGQLRCSARVVLVLKRSVGQRRPKTRRSSSKRTMSGGRRGPNSTAPTCAAIVWPPAARQLVPFVTSAPPFARGVFFALIVVRRYTIQIPLVGWPHLRVKTSRCRWLRPESAQSRRSSLRRRGLRIAALRPHCLGGNGDRRLLRKPNRPLPLRFACRLVLLIWRLACLLTQYLLWRTRMGRVWHVFRKDSLACSKELPGGSGDRVFQLIDRSASRQTGTPEQGQ
jgi:hypothetical protein